MSYFRRIVAVLFAIFVYAGSFCSEVGVFGKIVYEIDKSHHKKVERIFQGSFRQKEVNEKRLLSSWIYKIASYEKGQAFLRRLENLLSGKNLRLLISFSGGNSCFGSQEVEREIEEGKSKKSTVKCLKINLNLIDKTVYSRKLGLCTIVPGLREIVKLPPPEEERGRESHIPDSGASADNAYIVVTDMLDPYWMLLVHEMEHMEHWLEGTYTANKAQTPQDILGSSTEDYPEVSSRKRKIECSHLWNDREERDRNWSSKV